MKTFCLIALYLAAVAVVMEINQTAIGKDTGQDVPKWDDGGTIEVKPFDGEASSSKTRLREFLWNHWHNHRFGQIGEVSASIEGAPSKTLYSIEPDERGTWRIVAQIQYTVINPTFETSHEQSTR